MSFTSSFRAAAPLAFLALAGTASAGPYPRDDLHDLGFSYLMPRDCNAYCGSDNQYCCSSDEVCTTVNGDQATCAPAGGGYPYLTSTWTQTFTTTFYTNWEPAPEPTEGVDCVPKNDQQETCGEICCAGWQTCAFDGQCSVKPGYVEPTTVVITNTDGQLTTQYSAPYRVTGTTVITTTETDTATSSTTGTAVEATETSDEGTGAGGGGGGLSGGAIAGIVIGSIAGALLLLLLAFCCIARGLWNACFGRKKVREEVIEERYSGSRPPSTHHSSWHGGGGHVHDEKKSSGWKKYLGAAGLIGTMLALLNLKKDKKPARKPAPASRYGGSYYSYSDFSRSSPGKSHNRSILKNPDADSRYS